ncbi:hypothetical protein BSG18_57710 [Pseudomonas ogarae]|nr:hypothetical protein BSG18_57710 [Pseudomonas ogarae]
MVQLLKVTAQVSEARIPILCSVRSTMKPGVSVGTMNALMPRLPALGSVTANTITTPAFCPDVMNCLQPLST